MKKPIPPKEWLGSDREKSDWAHQYLQRTHSPELSFIPPHQLNEAILEELEKIWENGSGADAFARIKRAWNAYSYRKNKNKRTFSFVLPVKEAMCLKRTSKDLGRSQSTHLAALICEDRTHIEKLRNEYQQRLEGARKTRNSLVEDRKTQELGRLRKENARHAEIIKQYEELIRKLVEKELVLQELRKRELQDPLQLDIEVRDNLNSQAMRLAARHLEDAQIDASRASVQSAS